MLPSSCRSATSAQFAKWAKLQVLWHARRPERYLPRLASAAAAASWNDRRTPLASLFGKLER